MQLVGQYIFSICYFGADNTLNYYFNTRQLHSTRILLYEKNEDMFSEDDGWEWLGEINDKEWTKYTGQWDGSKGIGEINYKDGKKYIGEWGGHYGIRKHGLGTLYSADGKVLNKGRWEKGEYVGKK